MSGVIREATDRVDYNHAVQISESIYWVGQALPDDPFQCHIYLLANGDQSVLIDPGSKLTFKHALRKIEEVIPFHHIRYFICHHQDPDITGALPLIDQLVTRKDALIISHWRAIALLKHYGLEMPFWCVEENNWKLDLGGRALEFIFTPYMHFPGAFCTFDPQSGTLFSSDIFGGFSEKFSLFARDESDFDGVRFFHEHYMPSREILYNGVTKLETYPIKMIAPQHGAIVPRELLDYYFRQLKSIDCGLYLMTQTSTDIMHLTRLNQMLRNFMETMVLYRSFSDIVQALLDQIRRIYAVASFEIYAADESGEILHLAAESMFRGVITEMPDYCRNFIGMDKRQWEATYQKPLIVRDAPPEPTITQPDRDTLIILPLFSAESFKVHGLVLMQLKKSISIDNETVQTLAHIAAPMSVAVEREMIQRSVELERQRFYEMAIRDSLTGLYTRVYMKEAVKRLLEIHDRDRISGVSLIMLDIDHFKKVNDVFGHNAGDKVLQAVADIILKAVRKSDIPVRMGGEEFAIFITGSDIETAATIAERIRSRVRQLKMPPPMEDQTYGISGGIAYRIPEEALVEVIHRADQELYKAKRGGRNRISIARGPETEHAQAKDAAGRQKADQDSCA